MFLLHSWVPGSLVHAPARNTLHAPASDTMRRWQPLHTAPRLTDLTSRDPVRTGVLCSWPPLRSNLRLTGRHMTPWMWACIRSAALLPWLATYCRDAFCSKVHLLLMAASRGLATFPCLDVNQFPGPCVKALSAHVCFPAHHLSAVTCVESNPRHAPVCAFSYK